MLLLPRLGWTRPTPRELTLAYPAGMLLATVAAVLVLLDGWLAPVAALLLLVPVAQLIVSRSRLGSIPRPEALRVAIGTLFAAALSVTLGVLLHGPSATLDSRAFGDLFYYINKVVSASGSLVPLHDLLAEGQRIIYVEGAPSFVGAALSWLPWFDPVLFNVVTLPCFLFVSLVVGARLIADGRELDGGLLVATIALSSMAYVTFLTESPPMAFALPLAFAAYRVWADRLSTATLAAIVSLVGVDLLLTKVVGLIPFGIVLLGVLLSRHPLTSGSSRARTITAVVVAGAGVVAIVVLFATADWYAGLARREFFPREAWDGLRGQLDGISTGELAPAATIVGQVALLAWLLRHRSYALAIALSASVAASWFVRGIVFEGALGPLALLIALAAWERRIPRDLLFTVAVVAILGSIWLREVYGVRTGTLLLLLGLAALFPAFERTRRALRLSVAAGAVTAAGVVALAATPLELSTLDPTLTRDDYTIWQRVNETTPPDALVFTSLTGPRITMDEGWNNYPSIAGRQLYIAGWYDGKLTAHPIERNRRLALNRDVLSGARRPSTLDLSRSYDGYYAVLRASETPPEGFEPIYDNDLYTLYRVAP